MKKLSMDEISLLASRDTVRKVAVENFLMSLYGSTREDALKNLSLDAKLYKWNTATRKAIRDGIELSFKK